MRAYAIHRPIGPYTYPHEYDAHVVEIVNFNRDRWCRDVCRVAWGYIEWSIDVPRDDLKRYDLVTEPRRDRRLYAGAKTLVRYERANDWARWRETYDKLHGRFGYGLDEIVSAICIVECDEESA